LLIEEAIIMWTDKGIEITKNNMVSEDNFIYILASEIRKVAQHRVYSGGYWTVLTHTVPKDSTKTEILWHSEKLVSASDSLCVMYLSEITD
jgi:hypothetical protein